MKNYIIYISLVVLVALGSCKKMDDLRVNPNNVSETHPQLLLTNVAREAFQVVALNPLYAGRMLILADGESDYQWYKWNQGSYNYYNELRDVTKMIEESEKINSSAYIAISKIFRAFYFYNLTIQFGDIPYTEALKGESEDLFTPKYDTQKDVFLGILSELEEANTLLTDNEEVINGDIIYYGDLMKWRKFANSFRLKVLLTLSVKDNGNEIDAAEMFANIYANQPIIESLDDNAQLVFFDAIGSRYTEFNDSRYASAVFMDSTFVQLLIDREDPRLFVYSDQTRNAKEAGLPVNDFTGYEGGDPTVTSNLIYDKAADGNISLINLNRYTKDPVNEPHMVLGYPEMEFILSEASLKGWITSDAKTHYENAVTASFEFYNTHAADYASYLTPAAASEYLTKDLVSFDNASTYDEKLERIITQKYIQFFEQGGWSSYYEHLRTGYPEFMHLEGSTPPSRWAYPDAAYEYNGINVEAAVSSQYSGNDGVRELPWWLK